MFDPPFFDEEYLPFIEQIRVLNGEETVESTTEACVRDKNCAIC